MSKKEEAQTWLRTIARNHLASNARNTHCVQQFNIFDMLDGR